MKKCQITIPIRLGRWNGNTTHNNHTDFLRLVTDFLATFVRNFRNILDYFIALLP